MKILITSDNHLGFKETDPIRFDDSFNTFEEILKLAQEENVDLILQGGDLFHENKPSRNTYNKTVQILRKYCIGEKKPDFVSSIPLNYNDSNFNISLPILSIHGNHDDPSGFNSISPLDILQSGGFINYFGRVDDVDNITLDPILIEKDRKIAIYGLGHIKDRRIYKTFMKGNVKYNLPPGDGWYFILMVHQNRVFRPNEYLPEDFIASFFNLVIYGHEHESIKIRHKNFDVIQVGSSIRTSLCEGESFDKYAYILNLDTRDKIDRKVLKTVRPFLMSNIKIIPGNPETQVMQKIENMIQDNINLHKTVANLLPLLRLRIELNGNSDFNKHRIYVFLDGKIANPTDSLRIIRKTEKVEKITKAPLAKNEIQDTYLEILNTLSLKTLIQSKVVESLKDFVDKDIKDSFTNLIKEMVESIMNNINLDEIVGDNFDEVIKTARDIIIKKDRADAVFSTQDNVVEEDSENIPTYNTYNISNEEFIKTVPYPKDSSMTYDSSIVKSKSIDDFTFIEDMEKKIKDDNLIKKLKTEKEENMKKQKTSDSDDDLLFFK